MLQPDFVRAGSVSFLKLAKIGDCVFLTTISLVAWRSPMEAVIFTAPSETGTTTDPSTRAIFGSDDVYLTSDVRSDSFARVGAGDDKLELPDGRATRTSQAPSPAESAARRGPL